jgi:acetolactate synthase I/II/III large subunit
MLSRYGQHIVNNKSEEHRTMAAEDSGAHTASPGVTVAQRAAAALARHGVAVLFGQSLPSALVLACEDIGIRQRVYRTENAGGAMADGYARRSGRIGVVAAQNGPAAALLVPPLAEALKSSVPVLALVQDVNRPHVDRNAFQELDHVSLFRACTKWVRRVDDASRVEDYIDMAVVAATSGRPGPAALLLPADVLNEITVSSATRRVAMGGWPLDRPVADTAAIAEAARLLATAKHPLIVAGGGIHGSNAQLALARLQQEAHLPVAYTLMGKGCVADRHPLTVGLIGNAMGRRSLGNHTRHLVDRADVILLAGSRTNQNGTDSWRLFSEHTTFIHLDIDGAEIGRNYEALRLCGDARQTLLALIEILGGLDLESRRGARAALESEIRTARLARDREIETVARSDATPIRPERLMRELQALLTPEATVVADASYSSVWITSYLDALKPGMRFLTPRGLAGLGWGYPMAVGAKLAVPEHPVVCISGDGGFAHVWSELETAQRCGVAVVGVVLNNAVLGFQKDAELVKFGRYTSACHFSPVDHAAIARACGMEAFRIESPRELGDRLSAAIASDRPTLLDIVTDPQAYPPLTMFDDALTY